jgi:hypothetical protein
MEPAWGLDLTVEVYHDAEYSTNLGRTSGSGAAPIDDEEEDEGWIQQPGVSVITAYDSPSLMLDGNYDIRRRIYDDSAYEDDTVVTGSASIAWEAIANRLTLDASNTRTETTIDSRDPFAPDNRQVTSTTSAGATLKIDSFGSHFVNLGYHYELDNTDETDSDSRVHRGDVSYVVPLSEVRRVQLNGSIFDEDFDDDLTPDTTTYIASLQFVSTGASVEYDVEAGYTITERELDRDDVDGVTGRGRLALELSSVSTFTLAYAREITSDTPSSLAGLPDPGEEFDDNSYLNEVYTSDDASATFATEIGRNQVTLGASYRTLDYEDVDADEDATGATLSIERRLRPTVRGSLFSSFYQTEYDLDGRQDDQWNSGVTLAWEGFRRLTLSTSVSYFQQESDDEADEYDEWRGLISIGYRLIGPR